MFLESSASDVSRHEKKMLTRHHFHESATEPLGGSLPPCALTRCEDISWRRRNAGHHAWPTRKFRCVLRCRSSQVARLVGSREKRGTREMVTLSHASSPTPFSQACYALNTQTRAFSGTTSSSSFLSFQVRLAPGLRGAKTRARRVLLSENLTHVI